MRRNMIAALLAAAISVGLVPLSAAAAPISYSGGVIPDTLEARSIHDENETVLPAAKSVSLASVHDSRTRGYVTAVKDQNPFGTCWTFGAMAAGESSLLAKGIAARESLDLSERHLAYFMYHPSTDPLGNTAGDSTRPGDADYLEQGGNNLFTTFALASWKGAAAENLAPYDTMVDSYYDSANDTDFYLDTDLPQSLAYMDEYHLQNSYWIPMEDRADVKKMILKHGAVAAAYYHDDAYMNYGTSAYYSKRPTENHIIAIVGWDDNYSRNLFQETCRPKRNGAWLVKNSWGDWFGADGYLWVSYEEESLNQSTSKACVFDLEPADNYDNNYQYDGSAGVTSVGVDSGGAISNIFKVTANPGGSERLQAVSFALDDTNVNYSIQIYRNLGNRTDPTVGIPALAQPVTGKTSYAGYYTIPLEKEIPLPENSLYSIVVQLWKDNGERVRCMVDTTYSNGGWIQFQNKAEAGQSFLKSGDKCAWRDVGVYSTGYSIRLKGFTDNSANPLVSTVALNQTGMTMKKGTTAALTVAVLPLGLGNQGIIWSSSDPKVATVDNGIVTAVGSGEAVITATSSDGGGAAASCLVTVPEIVIGKLSLKTTQRTLPKGKSYDLGKRASFQPANASIVWSSSKPGVVSVEKKTGILTAKAAGTAVITGTLKDTKGKSVKDGKGKIQEVTCKVTVPYKITYRMGGGKNHKANPGFYYKEKVALKKPARTGYAFRGWYTDSKYKKKLTAIAANTGKNLTLYAKWTKLKVGRPAMRTLKQKGTGQASVSWTKVKGAEGYQLVYSTNKKFNNKKTITSEKTSTVLKSLKKGKTCYVKVRAFRKDSGGKRVYGKYATVKTIKLRK